MRIAIYPGSFNPIHNGHLAIAEAALAEGSEEVWMVVSPQNPHKHVNELWPFPERLEMVRLVTAHHPRIKASDCENNLPRPSYTIRTLEYLKENFPQHQFRLLIGGDNLEKFHHWKEWERIIESYGLIVYPRSSGPTEEFSDHPNIQLIHQPLLNISASDIRKRVSERQSIHQLVPDAVEEYILQKFNSQLPG